MNDVTRLDTAVPTQPRKTPRSTTQHPEKALTAVLRSHLDQSNTVTDTTVSFSGVVLYSSYVSFSAFKEMHEEEFIKKVVGKLPTTGAKAPEIISSIIYIPDLCACLPPLKSPEFFRKLKVLSDSSKRSESSKSPIDILKESIGANEDPALMDDLIRISRYPRAYSKIDSNTNCY